MKNLKPLYVIGVILGVVIIARMIFWPFDSRCQCKCMYQDKDASSPTYYHDTFQTSGACSGCPPKNSKNDPIVPGSAQECKQQTGIFGIWWTSRQISK